MNLKPLKDISLLGRMSYGILCAENYLTTKYSDLDWTFVFEKLWSLCNRETWDEWLDMILELYPKYVYEFDNFMDADYEFLNEYEFSLLRDLYKTIEKDVDDIFEHLRGIEEPYAYTCIPRIGQASINEKKIVKMLEKEHINVPDPKIFEFSKFSEKYGWGNPFDGMSFSKILNKKS